MPDESHSEPPLKGNSGTASPQVNPSETPQLNDEVKNYVQTLIDFNHSKAIKEAELEYKKSINAIESKIKPLDLKVTSVTKSYNDLSEKFEELGTKYNELKNDRIRTIEMVSVFVALITFVSSQVNIFKDQTIGAALGFDLILSGILIAFVLLIHFVSKSLILEDIGSKVKNENTNSLPNYLFIVAILLVAFGVLVLQHEGTSKKIGQDATMIVQPVNIIQRM